MDGVVFCGCCESAGVPRLRPLLMRLLLSAVALLSLSCTEGFSPRPPPLGRFVYPTGILHLDAPSGPEGVLYVASSNFDRRFGSAGVTAIDLGALAQSGLPPFGAPVGPGGPVQVTDLRVQETAQVFVDEFGGDLAAWTPNPLDPAVAPTLYLPSRDEGALVHAVVVDAASRATLSCATTEDRDCRQGAASLDDVSGSAAGLPRAETPISVDVGPTGRVFVTNEDPPDSPEGSEQNHENYLFELNRGQPGLVDPGQFLSIRNSSSHGLTVGARYVYVAGRLRSQGNTLFESPLVQLVDLNRPEVVLQGVIEATYASREARGIARTRSEDRLYLAVRNPDALLVIDVEGAQTDNPVLTLINAVPLPDGASAVRVIEREPVAEGNNLVAITCTGGNLLALYDDSVGQVVSQIGVGWQPYGVAVDVRPGAPAGARLFVSNFRDGRVAVVDVPNLSQAQDARLVAHLGFAQECPTLGTLRGACERAPEENE